MKMSTERVQNNTDRVEMKYSFKKLLHCHILPAKFPEPWNGLFKDDSILLAKRSLLYCPGNISISVIIT
jgi:hypothetical protein